MIGSPDRWCARGSTETGESVLRPASWPEALDVAVRGLQRAGSSVGVLTGGRLTVEDAYGYAKFARAVLGTNNIDFRSRPHSAEEADFLAAAVAGTGHSLDGTGVTYADLETASSVLLVCFEPEEEAGVVFLRLRKAFRKNGSAGRDGGAVPEHRRLQDGCPVDRDRTGGRGGRSGRTVRRANWTPTR